MFFSQFGAFLFIRSLARSPACCAVRNVICVNELISTLKIFMFAQQQGILFGLGRRPYDQFLIRIYVFSCDNSLACFSLRFYVVLFCFVFVSIENVNNQQKKKKKQHRYDIDPFLRIFIVDQYFFIYISRFVYFKLLVGMIFISLNDFFWPSKLQHLSVDTFQCRHSVERREKQTVLIALIFFLRFFLSIFTIMF